MFHTVSIIKIDSFIILKTYIRKTKKK